MTTPTPEEPTVSKTLGQMTPVERDAAIANAVARLQAELAVNAPAIARALEDEEDGS